MSGYNLPPGCTLEHIERAAGAYDDDEPLELTDEVFNDYLVEMAHADGVEVILSIPGVMGLLREYYNNDIIRAFEDDYGDE